MAGGYTVPPVGDFGELINRLKSIQIRLDELERPTGSQVFETLDKLNLLINDLAAQVAAIAASGATWAGPVSTTGAVTAGNVTSGGTGTFATGVNSVGAYNLDVSLLAGARRTGWWHVSGAAGYAPSTLATKTDVDGYGAKSAQFLACMPVVFHYIGQLDIRDNPLNPQYDPDYVVPLEVGHLAELLIANGLGAFVFTDEHGKPAGINMAEFAAVGFVIVGRDHEARLRLLEARA